MKPTVIKQAYAFVEAQNYFNSIINKQTILELYTELDYVYDLLESLDIVSRYQGNEILKDFTVERGLMIGTFYIWVGDKSKEINVDYIIQEVHRVFTNIS